LRKSHFLTGRKKKVNGSLTRKSLNTRRRKKKNKKKRNSLVKH